MHRPERHGHVSTCTHNPEGRGSATALARATRKGAAVHACSPHNPEGCSRADTFQKVPAQPVRAQPGLQVESLFRESTVLNRLIQSEANATLDVDHALLLTLFAMGGSAAWHTE